LAGFDAEVASTLIGLTSAVFDGEALGKAAFELLMRQIKGETGSREPEHVLIPADIAIGRTTQRSAAPPSIPPTRKRQTS
jgi:DNA-binding LacI/PurR family transcriptional regulator